MMIQSVWKNLTCLQKAATSGVTLNPDLEPKTHHQTPTSGRRKKGQQVPAHFIC